MLGIATGSLEIVKELIAGGADPKEKNHRGADAYSFAIAQDKKDIIAFLREYREHSEKAAKAGNKGKRTSWRA